MEELKMVFEDDGFELWTTDDAGMRIWHRCDGYRWRVYSGTRPICSQCKKKAPDAIIGLRNLTNWDR